MGWCLFIIREYYSVAANSMAADNSVIAYRETHLLKAFISIRHPLGALTAKTNANDRLIKLTFHPINNRNLTTASLIVLYLAGI